MPSTQALLDAIINMQQNAQAALPVIPNNGNPRGANNMPANKYGGQPRVPNQPGVGEHPVSPPNRYSWLDPSPSVGIIDEMLAAPLIPPVVNDVPTPQQPIVQKPQQVGFGNETMTPLPPLPQGQVQGRGVVMPNQNPLVNNVRLPLRAY